MSLCINPECQKADNSETMIFCLECGSELLLDGRYRVVKKLGQGGFGTTYEILDFNSRSWVLKVLIDNHPKYVELFKQEVQVLEILDHPGIPKTDIDGYFLYFPEGRKEPLHCIVMEKIEGLNLSQYIKKRGDRPIQPKRALRWLAELALVLEQVHNKSFFHRDIKPSNIMLRTNGCLALIDFGSAREVTQSYLQKMAAGEITGVVTQGYTPLEQMRGKAVLQSDFYALGGTMIYLLTAQNPSSFYESAQEQLIWRDAVPQISPRFAELIDRLMAFSPRKRPANSREIFNEAVAIDSSLKVLDESTSIVAQDSRFRTDQIPTSKTITRLIAPNNTSSQISPEFIERCRQELAEFIGPMANFICQRVSKQNPGIDQAEFCHLLAQSIPNSKHSKEFRKRLNH